MFPSACIRFTTLLFHITWLITLPACFSYMTNEAEKGVAIIRIEHQPITAIPANRIATIEVGVLDETGIEEVRLYLKTITRDWYVYLIMEESGGNKYACPFPPAKNDAKGIDYLFVVKNRRGEIFKTKAFRVLVQNNYQAPPLRDMENLRVFTEIASPPADLNDFSIPFSVRSSGDHLLANAKQYPYPTVKVPGPSSSRGSGGFLNDLGSFTATITLGGFGINYSSH